MIDYDIKNMIVYKLIKILGVVFCILMINWNVFVGVWDCIWCDWK